MSTLYGTLEGDGNIDVYYTPTEPVGDPDSNGGYPDESNYVIHGPVYAPRIYGAGLDTFEVASSGTIALTLSDDYTFSFGRTSNATDLHGYVRTTQGMDFVMSTFSSNAYVTLGEETSNVTLTAGNDIALLADNSVNITTGNALSFVSSNATGDISELSLETCNAQLKASYDAQITASNLLTLESLSNVGLYGWEGVGIESSNDVYFDAARVLLGQSNAVAALDLSNPSNITASACNVGFTVGEAFAVNVNNATSNPVLKVDQNKLTVLGDFDVHGIINSISQTVTELEVEDKTIRVATMAGGSNTVDGVQNDRAGLIIAGFPSNVTDFNNPRYDKSIRWNYGDSGVEGLLTSNGASNEAYWDVRGGSLRLTGVKDNASNEEIGFGMRINDKDELEMVRHWVDGNGSNQITRFVRFGRK